MPFDLVRTAVRQQAPSIEVIRDRAPNPGLVLRRGLRTWHPENTANPGQQKEALIALVANIPPPEAYRWAYARWVAATSGAGFDSRELPIVGRLYIGVTRDNPLEAGVTVGHAWGMPLIPGSALKGVARAASRFAGMDAETERYLFGSVPDEDDAEIDVGGGETGAVVFHDAWWQPVKDSKPFALERVTPHHAGYYAEGKAAATDFDSPIPAAQIAVQGSFRFLVEGSDGWRDLAMGMLTRALTMTGVGGKTSSGYGLFAAK